MSGSESTQVLQVKQGNCHQQTEVHANTIAEPLTGTQTAELVQQLYQIAGPRIGSLLVESNIVLTLAGARGKTYFAIAHPQTEDTDHLDRINTHLKEQGMRFCFTKQPDGSSPTLKGYIQNLQGYERVSRLTHKFGIRQFDASGGWEGLRQWDQETLQNLYEQQSQGKIAREAGDVVHILEGVALGYPDQAIEDRLYEGIHERTADMIRADIPEVDIYQGEAPLFNYYKNHSNAGDIKNTINLWRTILQDFYAHPWHQALTNDQEFKQMRQLRDQGLL